LKSEPIRSTFTCPIPDGVTGVVPLGTYINETLVVLPGATLIFGVGEEYAGHSELAYPVLPAKQVL
jgi:hypothetical protein